MTITYTTTELKINMSTALDCVQDGGRVLITRCGKLVGIIVGQRELAALAFVEEGTGNSKHSLTESIDS